MSNVLGDVLTSVPGYVLVVAEVRRGLFEERNFDSIGFANLLDKETTLLVPGGHEARGVITRRVENVGNVYSDTATQIDPPVIVVFVQPQGIARAEPAIIEANLKGLGPIDNGIKEGL